jgi:hypothetical protein
MPTIRRKKVGAYVDEVQDNITGICHMCYEKGVEVVLVPYLMPGGKRDDNYGQCPNCAEPNKQDSKFCSKCRMVLAYDSYNETLQNQKEKEDKLIPIEQKFESMQEQLQAILVLAFSSLNQEGKNELARKLVTNTTYTAE